MTGTPADRTVDERWLANRGQALEPELRPSEAQEITAAECTAGSDALVNISCVHAMASLC